MPGVQNAPGHRRGGARTAAAAFDDNGWGHGKGHDRKGGDHNNGGGSFYHKDASWAGPHGAGSFELVSAAR